MINRSDRVCQRLACGRVSKVNEPLCRTNLSNISFKEAPPIARIIGQNKEET